MRQHPSPDRPSRLWPFRGYYGWAVVATIFTVSVAQTPMYGPVFGIFVKPIADDLGWSHSTVVAAFTIGSVGGSLVALAVGRALDRYGARVVVALSGVAVACSLAVVAVMREPWHFWLAYGLGRSIAVGGVSLGGSVAIANWFVRRRGRATAIRATGQRGGQSVVPLALLPVLVLVGWRWSFAALALFALVFICVPALAYLRRRPEDYGLLPDGATAPTDGNEASATSEHAWTLDEARRTRTLWFMVVGLGAGIAAQIGVNVTVVAHFQDAGLPEGLAISISTVFTGVSALSMLVWGSLVDRWHVRWVCLGCMVLFTAGMGVLLIADTYPLALVFAVLFGLGTGGWTVSQMLMVPNYFGRTHAGSIKGFISPFEGVMALVGPQAAALIHDVTGSYHLAFAIGLGVFGVASVAFALAAPPSRRA
ncbi:MAG: MFS transporter [Chloroflexota bacterium]